MDGFISYDDMTATFAPDNNLLPGVEYTATITTGVTDLSGKSIPSDSTWKFTTGFLIAPVLPYVTATDPSNLATGVALNKVIKATFSKVMDDATINSSTFKLFNGTSQVYGSIDYVGNDGFFTPFLPLLNGTTYNAIVTTGAKDLDGNAMAANKEWSFTTPSLNPQYTVTLTSNPTEGGSTSGGGLFNAAASVTVVATPAMGFTFTNWTESGIIVSTLSNYTFVVNSAKVLTANFAPDQFVVSLSPSPALGGSTSGGGLFNPGSSATVTATPNTGFTFTNWTEAGVIVSTNANYTFVVNNNKTLVANFTSVQFTIGLSRLPLDGGNVNGGGLFNSGASVTVSATSNPGFSFNNWTEVVCRYLQMPIIHL